MSISASIILLLQMVVSLFANPAALRNPQLSTIVSEAIALAESINTISSTPQAATTTTTSAPSATHGGGVTFTASTYITPAITFNGITENYGTAPITLSAISNSPGAFTFTNDNPSVATIVGNTLTIVGGGTTIITATQAASGNYSSALASAMLTVNPILPVLTFSIPDLEIDHSTLLSPNSSSSGSFSFMSTDASIASITSTMSDYYAVGNTTGTTVITVTQASSTNYLSCVATTTINVVGACEANPDLCLNSGTCNDTSGDGYTCTCAPCYEGFDCETFNVEMCA